MIHESIARCPTKWKLRHVHIKRTNGTCITYLRTCRTQRRSGKRKGASSQNYLRFVSTATISYLVLLSSSNFVTPSSKSYQQPQVVTNEQRAHLIQTSGQTLTYKHGYLRFTIPAGTMGVWHDDIELPRAYRFFATDNHCDMLYGTVSHIASRS